MANRTVILGTPNPCSPTQLLSQKMSQLFSQHGAMGRSTASTQSSYLHGMLIWICNASSPTRGSCSTSKYVTKCDLTTTVTQRGLHCHHSRSQGRQFFSKGSAETTHQCSGRKKYAQKTRQMLLQPPMFKISRDFIVSLEGLHVMEHHLENGQHTTAFSIVDHYMGRPDTTQVLYQHQMEDIIFGYLTCASVLVLHFYHLATFHSALKVTCIVLSCSFKALRMIVETQS